MINKIIDRFKFLHYIGFHNKNCRRRVFTTKNDYICIKTGNIYKKIGL
jgi:hypothetical protein